MYNTTTNPATDSVDCNPVVAQAVAQAAAFAQDHLLQYHSHDTSSVTECCSESTSSSNEMEHQHHQTSSTAVVVENMLTALQELQSDWRLKHAECDALQGTVQALSQALRESDEALYKSNLEVEQLQLKLQGVTFCEELHTVPKEERQQQGSDVSAPEPRKSRSRSSSRHHRTPSSSSSKTEMTTSKRKHGNKSSSHKHVPKAAAAEDESSTSSGENDEGTPIRKKKSTTAKKTASKKEPRKELRPEETPEQLQLSLPDDSSNDEKQDTDKPPCQAAFYQVIMERDEYQKKSAELDRALTASRERVRVLQNRLSKSTALVELVYEAQYETAQSGKKNTEQRRPKKKASKEVQFQPPAPEQSPAALPMPNKPRLGESVRHRSIQDDNKSLPLSWLTKDNPDLKSSATVLEQEYLEAIQNERLDI